MLSVIHDLENEIAEIKYLATELTSIHDLENEIAEIKYLATELTRRAEALRKILDNVETKYYDLRE